jgi:F0F1-type ATP synthase epsilon subunit
MARRQNASTGEMVEDPKAAEPAGQKPKVNRDTLRIKVWSPFHVYYDGLARSISGVNGTGPFDVLPQHHNFITLLNKCDLILQAKEGEVKIRISGGVMQVHRDAVTVYLEA